uniref:(California timema) hypothetical protein n=1 Tax=Timema californicum TaxID=61474 RepID=A0A7R9JAB0_TIMCA|nr:unnamed protein product [Timema californicum]
MSDAVMEEFRQNGRDSEYCPELENGANKLAPVLQSVSQHFWRSMEGDVACVGLQNSFSSKKERRSTKQQPKECVFCKNNGEESVFYKGHVLKHKKNRTIVEPVKGHLRSSLQILEAVVTTWSKALLLQQTRVLIMKKSVNIDTILHIDQHIGRPRDVTTRSKEIQTITCVWAAMDLSGSPRDRVYQCESDIVWLEHFGSVTLSAPVQCLSVQSRRYESLSTAPHKCAHNFGNTVLVLTQAFIGSIELDSFVVNSVRVRGRWSLHEYVRDKSSSIEKEAR